MFGALRQNSTVYVLTKDGTPTVKTATVVSVSAPRPKLGAIPAYGQPQETVVDIQVKTDESTTNFEALPSQNVIAFSGNIVVSETREAILAEAENSYNASKAVVESAPHHKVLMQAYGGIIEQLNPQIAKERAQAKEIETLKSEVKGMKSSLDNIQDMLSRVLNNGNKRKEQQ